MKRVHKVRPASHTAPTSILCSTPHMPLAGRTALHRALGGGFVECAALLIEKGADPNQSDSLKRTSLHWAAMGPPPGVLEVACSPARPYEPLCLSKRTRTPLPGAPMAGNVECCALIFAKVESMARWNTCPLVMQPLSILFVRSSAQGDGEVMLTKTTKSGSTPLHSAAGTLAATQHTGVAQDHCCSAQRSRCYCSACMRLQELIDQKSSSFWSKKGRISRRRMRTNLRRSI